jgi:hypothetical protein
MRTRFVSTLPSKINGMSNMQSGNFMVHLCKGFGRYNKNTVSKSFYDVLRYKATDHWGRKRIVYARWKKI